PIRAERPARSEEWSEVPPEIEELLRAQMAGRIQRPPQPRPAAGRVTATRSDEESPVAELEEAGAGPVAEGSGAETVAPARRGRPPKSATAEGAGASPATEGGPASAPAAKARRGRPAAGAGSAESANANVETAGRPASGAEGEAAAGSETAAPARRRRTTRG